MGTFIARTNELLDRVGNGKIQASVKYDQPYAEMQHEATEFKHRRGGYAHFLRDALFLGLPRDMRTISSLMFDENMRSIFIRVGENIEGRSERGVPIFMGDLRASGEVRVKEGGAFVYRSTALPRMSKRYAEGKSRLWHETYGYGF